MNIVTLYGITADGTCSSSGLVWKVDRKELGYIDTRGLASVQCEKINKYVQSTRDRKY